MKIGLRTFLFVKVITILVCVLAVLWTSFVTLINFGLEEQSIGAAAITFFWIVTGALIVVTVAIHRKLDGPSKEPPSILAAPKD